MENESNKISAQATSFFHAYQRCDEKRAINTNQYEWLLTPSITCLALSVELNFKAIISYEKKDKNLTHCLLSLFHSLNGKTQNKIIAYTGYEKSHFLTEIKLINDAFEEWRYIYEKGDFNFNPTFMYKLGVSCQKLTSEVIV